MAPAVAERSMEQTEHRNSTALTAPPTGGPKTGGPRTAGPRTAGGMLVIQCDILLHIFNFSEHTIFLTFIYYIIYFDNHLMFILVLKDTR